MMRYSFSKIILLLIFSVFFSGIESSLAKKIGKDSDGRRLIPEIMELKDGQVIPKDVFTKYDSRTIGESLVARIAISRAQPKRISSLTEKKIEAMRDSPMSEGGYFALDIPLENREIHIYRSTKNLRNILKTGFLNLHQTGTSSFDADSYRRLVAEDKFAGLRISRNNDEEIPPEDKTNFLRPKYGILEVQTNLFFGIVENTAAEQMGPVTAVLKPDVIKRTTYTFDDSLLMYDGNSEVISKSEIKKFLRPLSEAKLHLLTPANYFETQTWGEVDLRDVKEWIVGESVTASEIKILKESGLPIYRQAPMKTGSEQMSGRVSRERGRLLYPGDEQVARKLITFLDSTRGKILGSSTATSCPGLFLKATH